jgi:hypothetical protein
MRIYNYFIFISYFINRAHYKYYRELSLPVALWFDLSSYVLFCHGITQDAVVRDQSPLHLASNYAALETNNLSIYQ